jgi:hypothetical protein
MTCPQCAAPLVLDPMSVTWCDACSWNVAPDRRPPKRRLERIYAEAGRRSGEALLEEVVHRDATRPDLTPGVAVAYVLAGLVYVAVAAAILGGAALAVVTFPNPATAREQERRRRAARLETARLDVTHPPLGALIASLERRPHHEPSVRISAGSWQQAEAELAPARAAIGP